MPYPTIIVGPLSTEEEEMLGATNLVARLSELELVKRITDLQADYSAAVSDLSDDVNAYASYPDSYTKDALLDRIALL